MYIIIVGGGEVGYELAHHLFYQGQNVVVIENDAGKVERFKGNPGLKVVEGNGAQPSVLEQAGIKKADLLIAVTDMDEVNTIACFIAKRYYVTRTICRIRGDGCLREDLSLSSQFGIDMVINPEKVAAVEILKMLHFPNADEIKSFVGGRVILIGLTVDQKAAISGIPIRDLAECGDINIVGKSKTDGKFIILDGKDIIEPGSKVYLLRKNDSLKNIGNLLRRGKNEIRQVVIIGGGEVGRQVAMMLENNRKQFTVKLIEKNINICKRLNLELQRTLVLHGDATEISMLKEEDLHATDAVIVATNDDRTNIVAALMVRELGVKKIISEVKKTQNVPVYKSLGLESLINPRLLAATQIILLTRSEDMFLDLSIFSGEMAEVSEIVLQDGAAAAGRKIKEAHFPPGMLIGAIVRGEEVIIPHGETVLKSGDHLVIFSLLGIIDEFTCFFASDKKSKNCTIN